MTKDEEIAHRRLLARTLMQAIVLEFYEGLSYSEFLDDIEDVLKKVSEITKTVDEMVKNETSGTG